MNEVKTVEKLWGREIWHHNDARYCMKTLLLHDSAQSSLHCHRHKCETFVVTYGTVLLEYPPCTVTVLTALSDAVTIEPGAAHAHRFRAVSSVAHVAEASTEHDDDDVVRIEEARKTDLIHPEL
jgi:mannose-6-phosphate isomerase-like protein (cupin superfamily)